MRVHAVISAPRTGLTTPFMSINRALFQTRIEFSEYSRHAYWHQSLSRKLEDVIEQRYDAALVFDYDSVVCASNIIDMLKIFEECPWIDALMPVQQRRGGADIPMMTQKDDAGLATRNLKVDERDERVSQCESGHFGMTLLRLDKLEMMRRPWFFDIPNFNGIWEDEDLGALDVICDDPVRIAIETIRDTMGVPQTAKVDNDIWFWKQWHRSGNNLFVARDVNIGHLQEVVTMSSARTHQDYNLDADAYFAVVENRKSE